MGSVTREFENKLLEYWGVKHVVAVNTGTSALHIALEALSLQPGAEVIVLSLSTKNKKEVTSANFVPLR